MIRELTVKEDSRLVEDYIGNSFLSCPYFYANLKKYGVEKGKTRLFIMTDDKEIHTVALLYYDCLHLYYKDDVQQSGEMIELIHTLKPRTIFSPLYADSGVPVIDGYRGKEVLIMSPQGFPVPDISAVKNAELSDLPRIAQFMYTFWNDIYESAETICTQMQERIIDQYGRTKYIEDGGDVVACFSSYAELDDFAVCGGLLVADSQRGKKLGSVMVKSIHHELINEGKKTFDIINDEQSRLFHEKNGFVVVGKMAKYNCVI